MTVFLPILRTSHPQYFAVIAHNMQQQRGFGSALPPEESHITPGGQFTPIWEPLVLVPDGQTGQYGLKFY